VMVRPDSGRRDATAGADGGPGDPCAATVDDSTSTVGCNGGLYGSTPRDGEIDGPCTPDGMDGPGTCAMVPGVESWCAPDEVDPSTGTCVLFCPTVSTYVSTGSCPSGSRCFDLTDVSICFRDCNGPSDCFAGETCDGDGSCAVPPPPDGGVPTDAGAPDGGPDGGAPDASAPDGGAPDAG